MTTGAENHLAGLRTDRLPAPAYDLQAADFIAQVFRAIRLSTRLQWFKRISKAWGDTAGHARLIDASGRSWGRCT